MTLNAEILVKSRSVTEGFREELKKAIRNGNADSLGNVRILGDPHTQLNTDPELLGENLKSRVSIGKVGGANDAPTRRANDRVHSVSSSVYGHLFKFKPGRGAFWASWCGHRVFGWLRGSSKSQSNAIGEARAVSASPLQDQTL